MRERFNWGKTTEGRDAYIGDALPPSNLPLSREVQLEMAANDILANAGDEYLNADMKHPEVFKLFESIDGGSLRGPPSKRSYEPTEKGRRKALTVSPYPCPQCGGPKSKYSGAHAICNACYTTNGKTAAVMRKVKIKERTEVYNERFSIIGYWMNYWMDFYHTNNNIDELIDRISTEEEERGCALVYWDLSTSVNDDGFRRASMRTDKFQQMVDGLLTMSSTHKYKKQFYVDEHSWPAKHEIEAASIARTDSPVLQEE